MLVRLIELPAGRGGAVEGTPGNTGEKTPPKEIVVEKPKNPKTTLPGKEPPPPKQGPSPVASDKPGKALGLGHEGPAGLGGKGVGVILDEPTFMYEWYRARLEDMLKSNWRRPALEVKTNIAASVHFTITSDGQAQDVAIVQSSGNVPFDQSVIRAVYGSVPFPKFPPQYSAPRLGVMYTFEMLPEGSQLVPWSPPPKAPKGKRGGG
jgi:TonB family protein